MTSEPEWHYLFAACDLLNAGGCGRCREPRKTNPRQRMIIMNVKTNVKVGYVPVPGKPLPRF
jgi:hypothetical protein